METKQQPHEPRVTYQRAWDEWRSECSCGWVGSYWQWESKARAVREATNHAADSN